ESSKGRYTREDEINNDGNDPDTSTNSSIYPGKLCYGEFRLACITSSPSHDQPVHLDLEIHSMDNCPEYETASYTWGGEEDDNTKKYPVFVGPYGDVSFQTRNWIRLMWIDAICINQEDAVERGSQVDRMGAIYRQCIQVVVYLGPDIAWLLPPGQHAKRRTLEPIDELRLKRDLNGLPVFGHETVCILCRRFFTRLWVVQEIPLASCVLMRVEILTFGMPGHRDKIMLTGWIHSSKQKAPG
ncbi:uncharacterized protein PODANS_4_1720, partial [Podospora anserina S mat+]